MSSPEPEIEACAVLLAKSFPVEDIWSLTTEDAHECGLETPENLVVIVRRGSEAHEIEQEANLLVQKELPDAQIGIHVFSIMAIERTPRPLLVKMALRHGEIILRA